MDQPWNSAANAAAMRRTVAVLQHPDRKPKQDSNGFALSHFTGNVNIFSPERVVRIRDVRDGASNTLLAGEAAGNYKPWGDPTNLRDPAVGINKGSDTWGGTVGGGVMLLVDGSARFVSENIDPATLKALSTPAGGEVVNEY